MAQLYKKRALVIVGPVRSFFWYRGGSLVASVEITNDKIMLSIFCGWFKKFVLDIKDITSIKFLKGLKKPGLGNYIIGSNYRFVQLNYNGPKYPKKNFYFMIKADEQEKIIAVFKKLGIPIEPLPKQ